MCERLELIKEDYQEALKKYNGRNALVSVMDECFIQEKWEYVSSAHYEVLMRMNYYLETAIEPQINIANTIYDVEMDFNKALGLSDNLQKERV